MKIEYIVNRDKKTVVARFKYDSRKGCIFDGIQEDMEHLIIDANRGEKL